MMLRTKPTPRMLVAALLAALAAAPAARADVTIESRLTIESIGGGGSGAVTSQISGLKKREDRRLAFTGRFAPARAETTEASITRLDRGLLYRLDPADASYDEVPLARLPAMLRQGGAAALPGIDPASSLDLTWTVETSSPGGSETIAGFAATPSVITLRGKGMNRQSGQPVEMALISELWTAPDVPGAAELRAFDARYAKAVGMDPGALEETLGSFGLSKAALGMLSAARAKVSGTPLRTVMRLEIPALSNLLRGLATALPQGGGEAAPADSPLITSTVEVTSIARGRIPVERFGVPAGYRRKAVKLAPTGG